jgi:hypothetical protein
VCIAFSNIKLNFRFSRYGLIAAIYHLAIFHIAFRNPKFKEYFCFLVR